MKDNTLLMVGGGILLGYLLMPKQVKEVVGGGTGGGGFNIPGFPGWESLVKVPGFPGWDKLVPEFDVPSFPEVPPFPGWDKLVPEFDVPSFPEVPPFPGWDALFPGGGGGGDGDGEDGKGGGGGGFIPSYNDIKKIIEDALGRVPIPDPRDLTGIIPETFPFTQKVGDKRTFTEKLFGVSHNEEMGVWDRWGQLITGGHHKTPITERTVSVLNLEKDFWRSLFSSRTKYKPLPEGATAAGILGDSESPSRSEFSFDAYEPEPGRDSEPVSESSYTTHFQGKNIKVSLDQAMQIGGGT